MRKLHQSTASQRVFQDSLIIIFLQITATISPPAPPLRSHCSSFVRKRNCAKEFWTILQSISSFWNSTMDTYPILKKPLVLFSPGTPKTYSVTEICFWGIPTYWGCTLWEMAHRRYTENLLIFAHWRHLSWAETHRTWCMLKQTITQRVSKTVKATYFGHFLSIIPKCQGSPP